MGEAIGSTTGDYGVYATSKRLFVIYNPTPEDRRNDLIQFRTFVIDKLFGTNIEIRPHSIEKLEAHKVFEVW